MAGMVVVTEEVVMEETMRGTLHRELGNVCIDMISAVLYVSLHVMCQGNGIATSTLKV